MIYDQRLSNPEALHAAALPAVERSACIEREAAAVLRTLIDDDGDGAEECNQSDMGSLTGWQALADQVYWEISQNSCALKAPYFVKMKNSCAHIGGNNWQNEIHRYWLEWRRKRRRRRMNFMHPQKPENLLPGS